MFFIKGRKSELDVFRNSKILSPITVIDECYPVTFACQKYISIK